MRVISGEKRGLPLKAVPGASTRPTTDKVKESIFNMIGPYFNGGNALDLYAGSGGLGIEALSRGIDHVIFVDQNRKAIEIVKQNIAFCGFEKRAEVYRNDADRALKALIKREIAFSYVFLDPPYAKQNLVNEIRILIDFELLTRDGMIVCEHGRETALPDTIGEVYKQREESYGDTTITIYTYEEQQ
ncbi:16S rRNA (guanine(966)-N(2))-methyltransferase RsmD [Halalkalibacter nanhaiisediminis]|uniref:16S rRNA (Guanine(966)-N(2))-methyltransferase RsmD n=1 Tax=Halalkalibacter nanhaiisediminis TaxID=688079 RepID=A0A562QGC5_9BACI|nr:16S rRNA (guanine(966)-N(2))-methyltransferase RsmD [Halalkalibacter nanhaiisediminis]TWI55798.1 16S rRNA (guanine(966)-N(2))-methyltransferase RsmD [Halalkalibacter nanhaiisediminis]